MLRQIITVVVALAILAAAFVFGLRASQRPEDTSKKPQGAAPIKTVQTTPVSNHAIQTKVPIYGRLMAYEKTELYAEVNGMLLASSPAFRLGMRFGKGDVILHIDDTEPRLALQAQRAALLTTLTQIMPDIKIDFSESLDQWDAYRKSFDVEKPIPALPTPKSDREKDFIALKNIYNQFFTIKSAEERLLKYIVRAPFAGEVTESLINTGSYIRAGQKIGTLMNNSNYELEASIALEDLQYVKIGDRVTLASEDVQGTWAGRIARVSSTIDTKTQTLKMYIQVSGSNLRENMFLTGNIEANMIANVVEIPRKLLVDNEKVYVLQDSLIKTQPIQLVKMSETMALVRGIPDGTKLLSELFSGIHEGMKAKEANTN